MNLQTTETCIKGIWGCKFWGLCKTIDKKVEKIYSAYRFSVAVFNEITTPNAYSYKRNGNCLPTANSKIFGLGKFLVVCWTQEDSFDEAESTANATQLANLLKQTLNIKR